MVENWNAFINDRSRPNPRTSNNGSRQKVNEVYIMKKVASKIQLKIDSRQKVLKIYMTW